MAFGFVKHQAEIEHAAVQGLHLTATDRSRVHRGTWKGEPCALETSEWQGPRIALFRSARLTGRDLEIVNVIGISRAPLDAPILGIDLVAARPDAAVIVADLSPLEPPQAAHPSLPAWARGIFSDAPLIERVDPGTAAAPLARVRAMVEAFVTNVNAAGPVSNAALRQSAIERYRRAHLEDERMETMLAHMFGAADAAMLMPEVLFPHVEEIDVHA